MNFDNLISAIVYLVCCYFLFWLGKLAYDVVHRDFSVKEELVKKDNCAFALSIVGYYLGLVFAIGGVVVGESTGMLPDLIDIFIYGPIAIILMNFSTFINDKLVLYKFNNKKEILKDQNAGTGAVELAIYLATGMIIFGSISGEGGGIITLLAFWAIGQASFIIIGLIYNLITPYNIHDEIEKDNVAAGVCYAGAIVGVANIVRHAISGDFINWSESLLTFVGYFVLGIILLPLIRLYTDKVLLPGAKLTDEIVNQEKPNLGVAFIAAFSYIGSSFLITWCI
ncbi:MAG: hypothetical protein SCARUB_02316 [Candidatus Scalindua rubra]|uniref:DUF350 domain-containing protein n=1 Tax=Candidatus Scalindua rubra TaxID=1872076 RepID=A0A1E3XAA1_9BACT|nr:MAG: hypothetical protein SCARUB_02316 [Candidatus Scalindua rubra]